MKTARKRPPSLRDRLAAGPVRGLGCANAVAVQAAREPAVLVELVAAACDSRAVVERFAQDDPYVKAGVVTHWHAREWNTVVGEEALNPVKLV